MQRILAPNAYNIECRMGSMDVFTLVCVQLLVSDRKLQSTDRRSRLLATSPLRLISGIEEVVDGTLIGDRCAC